MKMQKILVLTGLTLLFLGCGPSQKVIENNDALDAMVAEKKIEFRATSAQPTITNAMNQIAQSGLVAPGSTINRIDLAGSSNFLKIAGDSVTADLAYYGERQLGGGYTNNDSGVKFSGIPEDLVITKDEVKKSYRITFQIREKMESFNVAMRISSNLSGNLNVTSSHRTRISYAGTAKALAEKE
ncbi:DUF4251 domain-containing protein [Maribacter sp.]|nr:DUF4251 domain-containing protein [Maribacter sp.]